MLNTTNQFIEKLRNSGLRPTQPRIKICEVLFCANETFHFTISDLVKLIQTKTNQKISLATVYNTVHAFEKKGYLKEIHVNSNQSYFDTNVSQHHHFYDENTNQLIDLNKEDVGHVEIKKNIPGKKIKSVEVLVKIATDN
tara:strand:- start:111 stop:530 length:420 start_codon:yes stop_codon:yes gene_type:complete